MGRRLQLIQIGVGLVRRGIPAYSREEQASTVNEDVVAALASSNGIVVAAMATCCTAAACAKLASDPVVLRI